MGHCGAAPTDPQTLCQSPLHEMTMFLSSIRVKNDFNIAIDALIEFLKGIGCLRKWQSMRNNLAWPGTTSDNHIFLQTSSSKNFSSFLSSVFFIPWMISNLSVVLRNLYLLYT